MYMISFLQLINSNGNITDFTYNQIKQLYREYIYWLKPTLWQIYKYFYKLKKYKYKFI